MSAASAEPPVIELRGVSYRAGTRVLLDSVRWAIRRGEHWAVLGPNGAGKTTLLRLASGYLWPNGGGDILRFGEPLIDLAQLRPSIGWVTHRLIEQIPPREPAIDTVLSGRFGQVGLRPQMLSNGLTSDVIAAARTHLSDLNADDLAGLPFGVLSQGEQQKVLLARARMAEPLVIFLDEPCAGLDPGARERFLRDLQSLAEQESLVSLVLVTHHLEEIMPAFSHALVLRAGRVVHCGKTDVIDQSFVGSLYDTRPAQIVESGGRIWPIW